MRRLIMPFFIIISVYSIKPVPILLFTVVSNISKNALLASRVNNIIYPNLLYINKYIIILTINIK
jgi:hypothetical protein